MLYFVIVIIVAIVLYYIFQPQIKGWFGESRISFILSGLPDKQYIVLNNLLFKTENGTTQVDHIIVSIYGIFVVETKNYKGWIFGDDYSSEWTQVIYHNKHKFMNPIHQNYAHIKAVEARLTACSNLPVVGIIAFSSSCTLKTKTTYHVVYFQDLKSVIDGYNTRIIDEAQLPEVVKCITDTNINNFQNAMDHIKEIKSKQEQKQEAIANQKCPKCGGNLAYKNGKYGSFLGCSNYPTCKFTYKMQNK